MKNHVLVIVFSILFISCKNDNNLVEVQIPEPEVIDEKTSNFGSKIMIFYF